VFSVEVPSRPAAPHKQNHFTISPQPACADRGRSTGPAYSLSGLSPRLLDYIYPNKVERFFRNFKFAYRRITQFGFGQELWLAPDAKNSSDAKACASASDARPPKKFLDHCMRGGRTAGEAARAPTSEVTTRALRIPKLPDANFSAVKKSDRRPPMDVASIT
jgi:hypothetical protein